MSRYDAITYALKRLKHSSRKETIDQVIRELMSELALWTVDVPPVEARRSFWQRIKDKFRLPKH